MRPNAQILAAHFMVTGVYMLEILLTLMVVWTRLMQHTHMAFHQMDGPSGLQEMVTVSSKLVCKQHGLNLDMTYAHHQMHVQQLQELYRTPYKNYHQ